MIHIDDLVRCTEDGAIAASKWVGSGDKLSADKAATDALRSRLNTIDFCGKIIIGEGVKDGSYGLYYGEEVGCPLDNCPCHDIAVDPIEGTTPTVTSGPEALSVIGIAEEGTMFCTDEFYMKKLAYGPKISKKVTLSLDDPLSNTIKLVSLATGKEANKIMVCILNRPRHEADIATLREIGVRIKLIQDCDVSGAIATCVEDSGIDLLYGIGGAPEAVITACAMKCLGGNLLAQIYTKAGVTSGPVLTINDLVGGECAFVGTGITDGSLLNGVKWTKHGPQTHSVFMRSESGTVRFIETRHGN